MSRQAIWNEHQELIGPAEPYERDKVPSLFRPLAQSFLQHISLERGARVLDLACGTGIVARIVAPQVGPEGQVTGIDINPEMLRVARESTPPDVSITWKKGDAGDLPLADTSFDLVLCQQGFQFFPDKPRALDEMYRVLVSAGQLALIVARAVTPGNQPYQWAKVAAFRRHVSPEAGEKQRSMVPFFDGDSDLLQFMLTGAGFQQVEVCNVVHIRHRGFPETFITEDDFAELPPDVRTAVVQDIREAMQPYKDEQGTAVPYGFHIALAVK